MKIYAISKKEFNDLMIKKNINDDNVEERSSDVCLISITNPNEENIIYEHYFKRNHFNVLNLKFGDCEKNIKMPYGMTYNAMSKKQAKECYEFIKRNKHIENWIIHCTAGISRSAACAIFINDYLKGDKEEFKKNNPFISPNPHVYRLLCNEYEKDIL